jgi:choline dehydrogenase-like flavoprotein
MDAHVHSSDLPPVSVLVVEWGDQDLSWTAAAPYYANTLQTKNLMSFNYEPVNGLNNRTGTAIMGAVVGGGSTVNGLAFDRGSKSDYDAWEELGNPGWNWNEMLKYFKKVGARRPRRRPLVIVVSCITHCLFSRQLILLLTLNSTSPIKSMSRRMAPMVRFRSAFPAGGGPMLVS